MPETAPQHATANKNGRSSGTERERSGGKGRKRMARDGKDCDDCVPLRWAMMCKLVGRFEAVA